MSAFQRPRDDVLCVVSLCLTLLRSLAMACSLSRSPALLSRIGHSPPNTLFRLKRILKPGEWEVEGCHIGKGIDDETRPAGYKVRPNQELLIVTATHRPPAEVSIGRSGGVYTGMKWGQPAVTLRYATRDAFIRGLDDVLSKPVLTLAQEFDRDMEWEDWKGVRYSLRQEWEYVTGEAKPKTGCTPGERDQNNVYQDEDGKLRGLTPEMFQVRINHKIFRRRYHGHGTSLPLKSAYLTLDEVLAVRLYSGPAYQPINEFLRQIAWLSGAHREQLAKHAGVTFTATISALCRAIRKLAAITLPWETRKPLYRSVRGELPRTFWVPDEHGMVTAVETAFMSTSSNVRTCVHYMQEAPGANVLWQLKPKTETDAGFHRGADISLLSQFVSEAETLFPPCTMLSVLEPHQYDEFAMVNQAEPVGAAAARPSDSFGGSSSGSFSSPNLAPTQRRSRGDATSSARKSRNKQYYRCRWHTLFSSPELQKHEGEGEKRNYKEVRVLPTFV